VPRITPRFETLATGYGLVEGPRVDRENGLYFSDALRGGVHRRSPEGSIETVIPKRRGVGGIALHADGGIVVSGRNICHVRDGVSRIVFELQDTPGFNDLFTDAEGRVLVGSQRFSPFAQSAERVPGELYRIDAAGHGEQLYTDVGLTNGIGFSPAGDRLYHSDSDREHVIVHDVLESGELVGRRVFASFAQGAPDGLAVDELGCVWVACYGGSCVSCFTPEGGVDRHIEVPAVNVASLCFGGPDRRDLYVVSADNTDDPSLGGSIFRTRVEVAGLPVPEARV